MSGRVVLITGAGGGIGQALVRHFAGLGDRVVGMDRDGAPLEGLPAEPIVADLRDREGLRAAYRARFGAGAPDVLVNNAGIARGKLLRETTDETFDEDVGVNLTGPFDVSMLAAEGMKARGSGAIVNVSTVNALGSFGHPAYAAAKAAMLSMTRSMSVELGRYGIRVNAVAPGTVRTPAWNDRLANEPDVLESVTRWYPLRRICEPEDVCAVVAFLASDAARAVTGVVLPVDNGLTAGSPQLVSAFTREEI
jgi:NAD(P)-dependent dehydrogenase (short-subunit alcohol dehydrogenase family)